MQLLDRTVLVTGGSRGIGKEACLEFARHGADVIVNYNANEEAAAAVADEIVALGRRAEIAQADVASEAAVERLFSVVESFVGERGLNVIFNNAGIYPLGNIDDITVEQWDEVFAVNTRGAFLTTRGALPHLRRASKGRRIINIGSVIPGLGIPGILHYSAAKAAVVGFTHSLSRELAKDEITVNCLIPSQVATETVLTNFPGAEVPIVEEQSVKRYQQPTDLVGALVFLAGDASEFMTGQTLVVDGGRLLL